jgi:hypothetical protein
VRSTAAEVATTPTVSPDRKAGGLWGLALTVMTA